MLLSIIMNIYIGHYANPFSAGIVFIRQILTSENGPRTERIEKIILAVDQ